MWRNCGFLGAEVGRGKEMKVTLLVGGGGDMYYELGLCSGLISNGIHVEYIGSDSVKEMKIFENENVAFYNLRGSQKPDAPIVEKFFRILKYYLRLIHHAAKTDSRIFHIQWLNKFVYFDRILLNLYYKMLGKKLIFTAHNVNAGIRDGTDSFMNRLSLNFMYKLVDHIIVHTEKMKQQLIEGFGIQEDKVTVIPYGINDMVFKSDLTRMEARKKLNLDDGGRIALFFGVITPYKGLEYLLWALTKRREKDDPFRLIIAGKVDKKFSQYWKSVQRIAKEHNLGDYIIERIGYIADKDVEVYFKAADVLILPYKYIFQSGILFLAFNFGLPVIATDVGSLREFIIDGKTGFLCKPEDPDDLAEKINIYYNSHLFRNAEENREKIIGYANEKYSWGKIGEKTHDLYKSLL
jgi:D-inositol-3-phosphate glycosyltransferase